MKNRCRILYFGLIMMVLPLFCSAQDKLAVQCDRYVHLAGDTLWWQASMRTHAYTNLHLELRSADGKLLETALFPLFNGKAFGQLPLPDTLLHGNYWLRFYTQGSATILPLILYQPGDSKIALLENQAIGGRHHSTIIALLPDTLNTDPGAYNSWRLDIADTADYRFSCAVTDGTLPEFSPMEIAGTDSLREGTADHYLGYKGYALKPDSKKPVKAEALMTMLLQDSVFRAVKVIPLKPDGAFELNGLFFFGKASLLYQLNQAGPGSKEVSLKLDTVAAPPFTLPAGWIKRDTTMVPITTAAAAHFIPRGRQLKEVRIKGWRNPRKALDSAYTSGVFSEPALYAFDLRNEKYETSLEAYLRAQLSIQSGYNTSDTPTYFNHPMLFYVNEELKTWDQISDMRTGDIAYIKALESDFIGNDPYTKWLTGVGGFKLVGSGDGLKDVSAPTPMVVMIYTRKGKDIKQVPGLNQITINGYTPMARFAPGANGGTLLWSPMISSNHVRLRFYNHAAAGSFRLTIRGISDNGKEIFYTTVLR